MRVTKTTVKNKIHVLNKLRGVKQRVWENVSGMATANTGTMYLQRHGVTKHYHVLQVVNNGGAVKDVFTLESLTLREAYFGLVGMIEATERFQQTRS